jgi:ABC-type Fe2+-enterobactin transport system substrate-binding protein
MKILTIILVAISCSVASSAFAQNSVDCAQASEQYNKVATARSATKLRIAQADTSGLFNDIRAAADNLLAHYNEKEAQAFKLVNKVCPKQPLTKEDLVNNFKEMQQL